MRLPVKKTKYYVVLGDLMDAVVARVLCMGAKILLGGSPLFWMVASALLGVIHVFRVVVKVLLLLLLLVNITNNYLLNKNQQKKSSKLHALYLKIKK